MTVKSTQELTPDLKTFMKYIKDDIFAMMNCCSIGTIEKFDKDLQTASVQIVYKRVVSEVEKDYPLLLDCPVVVLSGGTSSLRFPIKVGDTCLVLFCDRNIDNWFASGNNMKPNTPRKHDISDGIALVGINSKLKSLQNYEAEKTELLHGTTGKLSMSDDKVALKNDTTEINLEDKIEIKNVASDLKTILNGMLDLLDGFISTNAVVGAPVATSPTTKALIATYKTTIAGFLK